MSFAFPVARFSGLKNAQRGAAITLLLCIHIAAIWLLLSTRQATEPFPSSVRETIITFPTLRPKAASNSRLGHAANTKMRGTTLPAYKLPPELAVSTAQPDLSGVGHSLFGCDPAAMLNPDQQAGCGAVAAKPLPEEIGMPKRSHVVQTKRWEYELAIKQSHRRIPCIGAAPGPGGRAGFMIDFVCVAKGLVNGFGEPK